MKAEKIYVYVGRDTNMFNATKFAMETLFKTGQCYVGARGSAIPKAIYLAKARLEKGYKGVYVAEERTYVEDIPDDGRSRGNPRNTEEAGGDIVNAVEDAEEERSREPRVRHVSVYEARLILQKEEVSA